MRAKPNGWDRNKKQLFNAQYERYGFNFCEWCGEVLPLTVHHIIFKSEKPNHRELNNKLNLILLCGNGQTGCHGLFHSNIGIRNELVVKRKLHLLFGRSVMNK